MAAQVTPSPGKDAWALVQQAQAGDSKAFIQLYNLYIDDVFRFFCFRTDNRKFARRLTKQTFLWALRNILSLNQQDWHTPLAWLIWHARSLAADSFVPEYPLRLTVNDPACGVQVPIAQLPFELQECVVLLLFMQLEPIEIAQIMECTEEDLRNMGRQINRHVDEATD